MRAYERLLNYVVVRTPSDENCENVPSSQCQFDLAKILVEELKQLGIDNAYVMINASYTQNCQPHRVMKIRQN